MAISKVFTTFLFSVVFYPEVKMIFKSKLKNFEIGSTQIDETYLIMEGGSNPIYYPTIFSQWLFSNNVIYKRKIVETENKEFETILEEHDITDERINVFISKIIYFLNYINNAISKNKLNTNIHYHTQIGEKELNQYINSYLIDELNEGESSVDSSVQALNAYYTFLAKLGICEIKHIRVGKNKKKAIHENTKRNRAYKYLSRSTRSALLRQCKNKQEKLTLLFGWLTGLRRMELAKLFLNDYSYGGNVYPGFLTLFDELESTDKTSFEYYITKSKGGKSRYIYIDRKLLKTCKSYFDSERNHSKSAETLLVTNDNATNGSAIQTSFANGVFSRVRNRLIKLNPEYSFLYISEQNKVVFHHCRHTFATDTFYKLLKGRDHHSVNSGDAVIIEVARLLGHSTTPENMKKVTSLYIRFVDDMLRMEAK